MRWSKVRANVQSASFICTHTHTHRPSENVHSNVTEKSHFILTNLNKCCLFDEYIIAYLRFEQVPKRRTEQLRENLPGKLLYFTERKIYEHMFVAVSTLTWCMCAMSLRLLHFIMRSKHFRREKKRQFFAPQFPSLFFL